MEQVDPKNETVDAVHGMADYAQQGSLQWKNDWATHLEQEAKDKSIEDAEKVDEENSNDGIASDDSNSSGSESEDEEEQGTEEEDDDEKADNVENPPMPEIPNGGGDLEKLTNIGKRVPWDIRDQERAQRTELTTPIFHNVTNMTAWWRLYWTEVLKEGPDRDHLDQNLLYVLYICTLEAPLKNDYAIKEVREDSLVLERILRLPHQRRFGHRDSTLRIAPYVNYKKLSRHEHGSVDLAAEEQKTEMENAYIESLFVVRVEDPEE